jgi:hypothetical protein
VNTPSHYIINLVFLGKTIAPHQPLAITLGAIMPDLPIFVFYGVSKWVYKLPESEIWGKAYYDPIWQNLVALFHSFPLAGIGFIACFHWQWQAGMVFCSSLMFHSLFDFPFHHDDAHRHFYPFSEYRFISPLSYWDPAHYGKIVAFGEILLVLALTPLAWSLLQSGISKGIIFSINLLYIIGYIRFYL